MCWEEADLSLPGMRPVGSKGLAPLVQDTDTGEDGLWWEPASGGRTVGDDDVISKITLSAGTVVGRFSKHGKMQLILRMLPGLVSCTEPETADS